MTRKRPLETSKPEYSPSKLQRTDINTNFKTDQPPKLPSKADPSDTLSNHKIAPLQLANPVPTFRPESPPFPSIFDSNLVKSTPKKSKAEKEIFNGINEDFFLDDDELLFGEPRRSEATTTKKLPQPFRLKLEEEGLINDDNFNFFDNDQNDNDVAFDVRFGHVGKKFVMKDVLPAPVASSTPSKLPKRLARQVSSSNNSNNNNLNDDDFSLNILIIEKNVVIEKEETPKKSSSPLTLHPHVSPMHKKESEILIKQEDFNKKFNVDNMWGLPGITREIYASRGIKKFYEWQIECLSDSNLLLGKNLVYSLPTSGGKVLLSLCYLLLFVYLFYFGFINSSN